MISDWRTAKYLQISPLMLRKMPRFSPFSWSGMSSTLTVLVMNKPDWPCQHLKFYNKYFSGLAGILRRTAAFSPLQSPRKSEYEPSTDVFSFDMYSFTETADLDIEMQRFLSENSEDLWLQENVLYPYCCNVISPSGLKFTMFLPLEALSKRVKYEPPLSLLFAL